MITLQDLYIICIFYYRKCIFFLDFCVTLLYILCMSNNIIVLLQVLNIITSVIFLQVT